ncbi:MAG: hypothetical protein EB127_22840, partial [Alphaproteobacteria bacterium]|nr:hypothetical protein [Alphaproteobacteria bacterium]
VPAVRAAFSMAGSAIFSCLGGVCRRVRRGMREVGLEQELSNGLHATPEDFQIVTGITFRHSGNPQEIAALKQQFHDELGNLIETYIIDNDLEPSIDTFRRIVREQMIGSKIKRLRMVHESQMGREPEQVDEPTAIALAMYINLASFDDIEYDNKGEGELQGLLDNLEGEGNNVGHFHQLGGRKYRKRSTKHRTRSRKHVKRSRKHRK